MSVLPELRPTLPEILERRGVPPRVTVGAAVALLMLLGAVSFVLTRETTGLEQIVRREQPVYNLLYTPGKVREVQPRAGEYTRLESRSGPYRAVVSIRPLELPLYEGNVSGLLPIFAVRHALEGPGGDRFELLDEAKARVNDAPGYQVGLRRGDTTLRRVYVVPEEDQVGGREGVILEFQETGKATDKSIAKAAKKAFRSFRFGTERG